MRTAQIMYPLFKNILLVVDLQSDKRITIKKLAEIVNYHPSAIHLLCIQKSWRSLTGFEIKPPFKGILKGDVEAYVNRIIQLQEWKQAIEIACPGVEVKMHIQKGFWTLGAIARAANNINPDLVIVNRGRRNNLFPFIRSISPDRLKKKLSCRVITVNATSHAHDGGSLENMNTSSFLNKS